MAMEKRYKQMLILCWLMSLSLHQVSAQTYHPLIRPNTYWDVMEADATQICGYSSGHRFFFQGDSTINGLQYQILQAYDIVSFVPFHFCHPYYVDGSSFYPFRFMREDTALKKVFIYDTWNNAEYLQYDFSVNVGDTLDSLYGLGFQQFVITSIDTVILSNGQLRKRFNNANNSWGNWWGGGFYSESIGGNQGIGFPLLSPIFDYSEEPGCIVENNATIYGTALGFTCLGFVGLMENSSIYHGLSISYNPSSQTTTITAPSLKGKNYLLRVFDLMGNLVFKEEGALNLRGFENLVGFKREINLQGLARSLYIVSLQTEVENLKLKIEN